MAGLLAFLLQLPYHAHMRLLDAVCVITGGGKGLGRALASELRARGARLVLGDLDHASLTQTIEELEACGLKCDVTETEHVRALADEAANRHGKIDVWINNAGIWMPYAPAEEIDFARARALMEVNFFGVAHGTVEAVRRMKPRASGHIVNIISVRALKGKALAAAYSASKFAAEGFTQAVREELRDSGVSITGVYPYRMKTELFGENKHGDYDTSMEPADVARIVVENLEKEKPSEHLEIWSKDDVRAKDVG